MQQWIDFQQSLPQRLIREALDADQSKARDFSSQGHALVRGVAGSGKSLVLRNRVEKLVQEGIEEILVLTYNRFMKGWLQEQLTQRNFAHVHCHTFHHWAFQTLNYRYEWDSEQTTRNRILEQAETCSQRYQAILVDEAQDFYDEWFLALLKVLTPDPRSLFFVYDNTQAVYGQAHRRKSDWTWKELGIDVVGRSQIFDLNYRNAPEILETAWKLILPALSRADIKVARREQAQGHISTLIEPKKKLSRSSGLLPLLLPVPSDVASTLGQQVQQAIASHPESSIGILVHPELSHLKAGIGQALRSAQIPYHAPKSSGERNSNGVHRPGVLVDSWNAVKGLEFDAVILVGCDRLPLEESDPDKAFQAQASLYTAMTRARDHLILLYQDETTIVEQIENAISAPDQLDSEP